ncbi:PA26 p53-induced protein-domain-containing protein [Phascolomyces articulosus]|uniref:PA26 p53-induced protein-domain-containing protein n=1 Tax=Phascolomyces articulosus TaxID=60185 RepID=A0AAD5PLK3_9FUNG|nr:PA26 p53-induced protein-domain-containing protein [Phascolomyces articulosus]
MNHDQQRQALASGSSIASHEELEAARDVRALQLQASRLRVALFKNLQVESTDDRQAALEKLIQVVKSYLRVARSPFSCSSACSPGGAMTSGGSIEVPLTPLLTSTSSHLHRIPVVSSMINNNNINNNSETTDHHAACAAITATTTTHDAMPYDDDDTNDESMTDEQLRYFLLTMLRLAHTCPFSDVRHTFHDFLQKTAESRVMFAPQASHLSPSIFIPLKDIFSLESSTSYKAFISYPRPEHLSISPWSQDTDDEQLQQSDSTTNSSIKKRSDTASMTYRSSAVCSTGGRPSDEYVRQMMTKTFIDEGRLANLFRVMSFFPTFYEIYTTTFNQILKSSLGPVSRTWKCYLGILAAAEHQCQYLVSMLRLEFLQSGGDPTWLKGIDHCPIKLRQITHLVLKLARQPWRLTSDDLMNLVRRPGAVVSETWSKGELVQAIVVISTFLGLSSFVLGCGIAPELDMRGGFYVHGGREDEYLQGVEHELDEWIPLSPPPSSGGGNDIARAAASTATGWHDSNITLDDSRRTSLTTTANEQEGPSSSRQHQPFTSDNGIGLGVSVDDDDNCHYAVEHDIERDQDMGEKPTLISGSGGVAQTKNVVNKLKSHHAGGGSPLKNVLLESLEKLNLSNEKHLQLAANNENNDSQENNDNTSDEDNRSLSEQEPTKWTFNQIYEDLSRFTDIDAAKEWDNNLEPEQIEDHQVMSGEYCWEDLGCDLVNQFLPELGDGLDEEFNEALSITDWTIFHHTSDSNIDTGPLRRAMWYYTQKILGLTKEDYDYQDIPTYLSQRNKEYIKKVCRQPYEILYSDWNNIGLSLRPEEKCHVNLLIASAKKQALLTYALAAVDQV